MASDNNKRSAKEGQNNNKKRPYSRFADPPPFRTVFGLAGASHRESTPFRNAPPVFLSDSSDRRSVTPESQDKPPPFLPPTIASRFNSPDLIPSQQFRKPPAFKQSPAISSPSLISRDLPPLSTQQVETLADRLLNPEPAQPAARPRPTMPPPPRPPTSLPSQLQSALSQSTSTPLPSLPWLTTLTSARSPPPPLASLLATARARILAADLTTPNLLDPTYASTHCFPPNLHNPHTESCSLPSDAIVQVLDVENLSKSRWEQVEELESQARGETKRGREIIRVTNDEEGRDGNNIDRGQIQANTQATQAQGERGGTAGNKNATHKLLLQDCKGQKVYGLELERVDKIGVGITSIGEKVLLKKGTKAARGVLLLEPGGCVVLGGRVGVWDAAWNEGRLERLKGFAERGGGGGGE